MAEWGGKTEELSETPRKEGEESAFPKKNEKEEKEKGGGWKKKRGERGSKKGRAEG